jgi:uncharacterized membrane protein YhfC
MLNRPEIPMLEYHLALTVPRNEPRTSHITSAMAHLVIFIGATYFQNRKFALSQLILLRFLWPVLTYNVFAASVLVLSETVLVLVIENNL